MKPKIGLPAWTENAGGEDRWRTWVESQVRRCLARARQWVKKRGRTESNLAPSAAWREAIIEALVDSAGSGRYSHLRLSLASPGKNTDWDWPSLDHVEATITPKVAVEVRLVNDMKGIRSTREFLEMVAHIAAVKKVPPQPLPEGWRCSRSFAIAEPVDEPPLPSA